MIRRLLSIVAATALFAGGLVWVGARRSRTPSRKPASPSSAQGKHPYFPTLCPPRPTRTA